MKKIFLLFTFLTACFSVFSQGIYFEKNLTLNDVLTKAEKENKFVFIDFYTTWCGPCKMMARDVFTQQSVGSFYNKHFVCASLNADDEENKSIVYKYVITSFPTFIFLNFKGEVIHRAMDGMSVNEFLELGKIAVDFDNNFKSLSDKVKNGDRSPKTLLRYFDLIPFSDEKEALTIEYLNTLSDNEKLTDTAWIFFRDYVQDVKSLPVTYFAKHTKLYIAQFGQEKIEKKMVNLFQNSYIENKKYFNSLKKYNLKFYNEVEKKVKQ